MPQATTALYYVFDRHPSDTGAHSAVRDLIAMPCRGARIPGEVVEFIGDSDCVEDLATHQCGTIRWDEHRHVATLLYVHPAHRRRGIATALWSTASTLHSRRTGKPLTISTARTVLGEVWARHLGLEAPLERLVLPLTPAAHTRDVPARLLVPDTTVALARDLAARYCLPLREVMACCQATVEAALAFKEGRR